VTLPNQAAGLAPFGLEFAFTNDGSIPGALNRTQDAITELLKGQMQGSEGWNFAHQTAFTGLPVGAPLTLGLLMKLAEMFTGLPLDTWGEYTLDKVTEVFDAIGTFTARLTSMFTNIDFMQEGAWDPLEMVFDWVESTLVPTGLLGGADWAELYEELTHAASPEDALTALGDFLKDNLLGGIQAWRLPTLPVSHITDDNPNLIPDGDFDTPETVAGLVDWTHDAVDGHLTGGCAVTTADGTTHRLYSNNILTKQGEEFDLSARVKWVGLTATASSSPLRLVVTQYLGNTKVGSPVNVSTVPSPSGSSTGTGGWGQELSNSYTTPAGVDNIVVELWVTADATVGTVKYDKVSAYKQNAFQIAWVSGLQNALTTAAQNFQDLLNNMWDGLFGDPLPEGVNAFIDDIKTGLQSIPPANVLGVSGGTIVDTFQDTIDNLFGGFARLFNVTGKSIYDVASITSDTVTTAEQGRDLSEWVNAVQGIRNNSPLYEGIDPTEESNFPYTDLMVGASPPAIINATSTNVPISFWLAPRDSHKGFISWLGQGVTNIGGFYIDVYLMNYTTNTMELVHTSPDQVANLSATWKYMNYQIPTLSRIDVAHGEVYAVAWRVQGTGTYQIGGKQGTWIPAHPSLHPAKMAATRTGVGNLAFGSIVYSGDVAWFGIGIAEGDVPEAYFSPRTTTFSNPDTTTPYVIPDWATYVDVILLGGGGSGDRGDPFIGGYGERGGAGSWSAETLVRGVDFPDVIGATINIYVARGGPSGFHPAISGGTTTRNAISGGKAQLSAAGGSGGNVVFGGYDMGPAFGESPGDFEYNTGSAPGGGGAGGSGGTFGVSWAGGAGARGAAWAVARMDDALVP
jgi:hypothetical protein